MIWQSALTVVIMPGFGRCDVPGAILSLATVLRYEVERKTISC
jgi:hypothetical protein